MDNELTRALSLYYVACKRCARMVPLSLWCPHDASTSPLFLWETINDGHICSRGTTSHSFYPQIKMHRGMLFWELSKNKWSRRPFFHDPSENPPWSINYGCIWTASILVVVGKKRYRSRGYWFLGRRRTRPWHHNANTKGAPLKLPCQLFPSFFSLPTLSHFFLDSLYRSIIFLFPSAGARILCLTYLYTSNILVPCLYFLRFPTLTIFSLEFSLMEFICRSPRTSSTRVIRISLYRQKQS